VRLPSGTMESVVDRSSEASATVTAADIAARYGLRRVGTRPSLGEYLRLLWSRRHFIGVLAVSKAYAKNQNNYLGQFWAVLNPVLTVAAYLFVFGVLLRTTRGVDNYIAFLVIGVFMYRFTATSITAGAKSVAGNLSLVRSLHFPRAVLPIAAVLTELVSLFPVLVVMCAIVLVTGEPIAWSWLLLPVAVALQWLFNTGCAFVVTRLVASARDLLNLLPFVLRILLYLSGVFFDIEAYVGDNPLGFVLEYQPVAVYLTLARSCLLPQESSPLDITMWAVGVGWAVLFLVGGFLFFWRAEERYGRD
jgi:teichoic acid transport system permease protein